MRRGARGPALPLFLFVHGYDTHTRYLKPSPVGYLWADPAYDGPGHEVVVSANGLNRVLGRHLVGDG